MIRKLFLFSLLSASFLIVSCSSQDKTGSDVGSGVDQKYAKGYYGNVTENEGGTYSAIMLVSDDGSVSITYGAGFITIEHTFKKEDIFYKGNQNGSDVYEGFKDGYQNQPFKFSFKGSSVTIHVNTSFGSYYEGTLSASGN